MSYSFRLPLAKKIGAVELDVFVGDKYAYLEVFDSSHDADKTVGACVTLKPKQIRQLRKALKTALREVTA